MLAQVEDYRTVGYPEPEDELTKLMTGDPDADSYHPTGYYMNDPDPDGAALRVFGEDYAPYAEAVTDETLRALGRLLPADRIGTVGADPSADCWSEDPALTGAAVFRWPLRESALALIGPYGGCSFYIKQERTD